MILFTGTGAISDAFVKYFPCKIISARFIDDSLLEENIASCDTIIHNAACIDTNSLTKYLESNFVLTKRIVDIAHKVKPDINFINISSMSILKTTNTYMSMNEMTDYALSKYLAETYCYYHPLRNLTSVRFSTIFYKNPNKDGLSKLAYNATINKKIEILNNGASRRDFIPIDIVAKYLHKLSEQNDLPRTINIVSGKPLSFHHFVDNLMLRNPNLEVKDIVFETKEVLHNFDTDGIINIGEENFDIDLEFNKYLDDINATAYL